MNKSFLLKTAGLFFIILVTILIIKNHLNHDEIELKDKKKNSSTITCSAIELKSIAPIIDVAGRIESTNKINIISEVNGITEDYNNRFEIGEKFKKGEILISINDDDLELELKSIKSQFLSLLVQVLPDVKMDYNNLGNKFEKYLNDYSLDGKIKNLPQPSNSKERNFLSSRQVFANYYTIKALENKLEKFKIRAPFDGVVTKALIDIGSNLIIGQPIGEFINPYEYEISTSVSVKESLLIREGNKVVISSEDLNESIVGEVKRIGGSINELTQSIDVIISINNNDVKDGMYATAKIKCDSIDDVYKIERSKILNKNAIYLIESGKLSLKKIQIVAFQNDSVIITGIENSQCVVDQYRQYFFDTMPIK